MRLDVYLTENGYADSRQRAKVLISSNCVSVNGKISTKPAFDVKSGDEVAVSGDPIGYVSRGALKLKAAFEAFSLSADGKVAIDVGASTGGFTEFLLQNGARKVYAVDTGTNQLAEKLRNDQRVVSMEKYNARNLNREDFSDSISFAVMDVSFISQTLIYPACADILSGGKTMITLVKPQFEAGKKHIGKGGIVRDKNGSVIKEIMQRLDESANSCGFMRVGFCDSPIVGGDGNREYLAIFKRNI